MGTSKDILEQRIANLEARLGAKDRKINALSIENQGLREHIGALIESSQKQRDFLAKIQKEIVNFIKE